MVPSSQASMPSWQPRAPAAIARADGIGPEIAPEPCEISVVVPVYRGEGCLGELYRRLCASLEQVSPHFEIILVEDCGQDGSWEGIQALAQQDPRVIGMQLSRNFGQHSAITAGLDASCGAWVVVMDCDLQDQPEEIPRLYAKAQEGHEMVLARRANRRDSRLKRLTSWMFYRLFSYLADVQYDGDVGNFRIISRKVVHGYSQMREQLRFFGAQLQWLGFPATSLDVEHAPRAAGKSSYSLSKLLALALDTIIAYSDKPLRLAVRFGFTMTAGSIVYGSVILLRALLHGTPVLGWSSLIVSMYFLGGIIICLLGVLGVYLGKTFDETKKRPLYVINHVTTHARE